MLVVLVVVDVVLVVVDVEVEVVVVVVTLPPPFPAKLQSKDTICPTPAKEQFTCNTVAVMLHCKGATVVVVVVVEDVLVDVVVVVDGFGTNTPTRKSKSSQQLFCPE